MNDGYLDSFMMGGTKAVKQKMLCNLAGNVTKDISHNAKFYADFIRFNFFNSPREGKPKYENKKLCFWDLPTEIEQQLDTIHKQHFYRKEPEEIFKQLGTFPLPGCKNSALQAKFVYEYKRKHGTLVYDKTKTVSDKDILKKLTNKKAYEKVIQEN